MEEEKWDSLSAVIRLRTLWGLVASICRKRGGAPARDWNRAICHHQRGRANRPGPSCSFIRWRTGANASFKWAWLCSTQVFWISVAYLSDLLRQQTPPTALGHPSQTKLTVNTSPREPLPQLGVAGTSPSGVDSGGQPVTHGLALSRELH